MIPNNTPLSEQIYAAHIEWTAAQRDYDTLESQKAVLRARMMTVLIEEGAAKTEAAARRAVEGSEEFCDYMKALVEAKYTAQNAKGKWEYLLEAAKEMRDVKYQDRLMAKI